MKQTLLSLSILFGLGIILKSQFVFAKTLEELAIAESGSQFGCELLPKPKTAGEKFAIIVPARFDNPKYWVTQSILLIGLDNKNVVQSEQEFKVPQKIPPKEVISIICKKDSLKIKVARKIGPIVYAYKWDGVAILPVNIK